VRWKPQGILTGGGDAERDGPPSKIDSSESSRQGIKENGIEGGEVLGRRRKRGGWEEKSRWGTPVVGRNRGADKGLA